MSAHDRTLPATPRAPLQRQLPPYKVSKKLLRVLVGISIILCAFIVWTGIIIHIAYANDQNGSWNFIPTAAVDAMTNGFDADGSMTLTVFVKFFTSYAKGSEPTDYYNPDADPVYIFESTMIGVLAFCVAIQSFLTVGLHCAELQVIMLRDEQVWRTISSASGSKPQSLYNSMTQPLHSLPNVTLLLFKPVVHWLFGSALGVDYAKGVLMRVPHVTYLMVLWLIFLGFVFSISFVRPKGPLPATYGHLQTMMDVADEYSDVMYWGDKGEAVDPFEQAEASAFRYRHMGMRHSGTGTQPLPHVKMEVLYS